MNKHDAVASLGQASLLAPARVRAALKANDRLKLYLTVLQAAATHAAAPERAPLDLTREIAAADIAPREQASWLRELPASAAQQGDALHLPDLARLAARLLDDLNTMARPVLDDIDTDPALAERVAHWQAWLGKLGGSELAATALAQLTHGRRENGDSLHLTVMDLHKTLNRLAGRLSGESIDGAHVWQLAGEGNDRPRVAAFMRGLNRTRALKLDHPGLDTAATRDGERLLIQNDIGTNDAHVLVLQVEGLQMTLTYSDLHRQRFAFFQALLAEVGASWSSVEARQTPALNAGDVYHVGTATFVAEDEDGLTHLLEGVGARIVFLIDWNRARKRLLAFVDKDGAVAVLREVARREAGHMAWLRAGGERLVWNAMAAQGESAFRLGDRLDDVLGASTARELLVDMLVLAGQAQQRRQPAALVADEARLLLARRLIGRRNEFALLEEHAGLCHALAQALRDGLAHGSERDSAAAERLASRAKAWERQADHLVMRARARAERQPQWQSFARLIERSDDVADALEEASFVLSLVADGHHHGWGQAVRDVMRALADAVLTATQDHVKAVAVVSALGEASDAADHDEFLDASWRVLQAERQCDELLRSTRRTLAREVKDPASLLLGNDLAAALEQASDALLALGYGLREHAFRRAGAPL
jgi:uncharacterized protein Yka (UPF0111/DUF47 family)